MEWVSIAVVGCLVVAAVVGLFVWGLARSALVENRRAREIPCTEIREQLATASTGELRRGLLRKHLRQCQGCAEFREDVRSQRGMLALALPVVPTLGLKESALAAAGIGGGGAAGGGGLIAALAWARAVEADEAQGRLDSRRVGSDDRRTETRPWASAAPGRRAEDILRQDLAEAHRALSDAEERLVEIEARQSA